MGNVQVPDVVDRAVREVVWKGNQCRGRRGADGRRSAPEARCGNQLQERLTAEDKRKGSAQVVDHVRPNIELAVVLRRERDEIADDAGIDEGSERASGGGVDLLRARRGVRDAAAAHRGACAAGNSGGFHALARPGQHDGEEALPPRRASAAAPRGGPRRHLAEQKALQPQPVPRTIAARAKRPRRQRLELVHVDDARYDLQGITKSQTLQHVAACGARSSSIERTWFSRKIQATRRKEYR